MSRIRDAQHILGWLEGGQLASDMSDEIRETLAELKEAAGDRPKSKAKGEVRLTLKFVVEQGITTIEADITSKRPKPLRSSTVAWVLDDGSLSTEHPKQINMFPREAGRAAAE
jgi:hypothetical protein